MATSKRWLIGLALVGSLVLTSPSGAATPSSTSGGSSYTVDNSGYTGAVQVPATLGGCIGGNCNNGRYVRQPARTAWRTNAYSGTQEISVRYRYFRWRGPNIGWELWDDAQGWFTVPPGYNVTLPADNISVPSFYHWRTTVRVSWWKHSNGQLLGRKYFDYSGRDYQCVQAANVCNTGQGWIYLG